MHVIEPCSNLFYHVFDEVRVFPHPAPRRGTPANENRAVFACVGGDWWCSCTPPDITRFPLTRLRSKPAHAFFDKPSFLRPRPKRLRPSASARQPRVRLKTGSGTHTAHTGGRRFKRLKDKCPLSVTCGLHGESRTGERVGCPLFQRVRCLGSDGSAKFPEADTLRVCRFGELSSACNRERVWERFLPFFCARQRKIHYA